MSALEIILLILGAVIAVVSYVIPEKLQETSEDIQDLIRVEVKRRVEKEVDDLRSHVDDVVDEAVEYAQEKTERSLERISNEKIMAVSEYSDTVLEEINKNHKEVMFLYDMLNDKQKNLKDTVSEANQAARNVEETKKEAEAAVSAFTKLSPEQVAVFDTVTPAPQQEEAKTEAEPRIRTLNWAALAEAEADAVAPKAENPETASRSLLQEQILTLHKQGQTSVQIAKMLNMGVGEVELITHLHGDKS